MREKILQIPNNDGCPQNKMKPPETLRIPPHRKEIGSALEITILKNKTRRSTLKPIQPKRKQKTVKSNVFSVPIEHHQHPKDSLSSQNKHTHFDKKRNYKRKIVTDNSDILKYTEILKSIPEEEDGLPTISS